MRWFFHSSPSAHMTYGLKLLPLFPLLAASGLSTATAAEQESGARFFREKVHPILQANCYKCHGGEKIKAGLVLTHREGLVEGGENGSALDSSDPKKSLLLDMVSYRDSNHEMPPAGKLSNEHIAILESWLMQGAPYDPALEKNVSAAKKDPRAETENARWWAYEPVRPTPAPAVAEASHPVDAFLQKSLAAAGLHYNKPASRETLARRAYYDLIGLPPSPEQVSAFVNDKSPNAWPRLIDSLLAKPEYGEKWARHWMDVVRYAESEGFERDSPKANIWRYRDYLIESFNDDVPYNQFVTEQLAGDELEPPTQRSLTATGFLRLMQFDDEPADRIQAKYDILADVVQVTGEAFLGMSIGCARCHDHKKDPITQKDYYSFMAFFHGMHDYGPTRSRPAIWLPPEKLKEAQQKQTARLAELDSQIAPLAKRVLEWAATKHAGINLEKHTSPLFDSQTPESHVWRYTQNPPPDPWKAENFSADHWNENTLFKPEAPIWMRGQFGIAKVPKDTWLEFEHSGETEIFINGTMVLNRVILPPGQHAIELGKKSVKLHPGLNTVAIRTTAQSRIPKFRILAGKPAVETAMDLLRKADPKEIQELNKDAKVDVVGALKFKQDAWATEAERSHGIQISAASESTTNPAPIFVHRRGNANVPGDRVEPAYPVVLRGPGTPQEAAITPVGKRSSGRRLALAKWMTDPANPLLSRVAVNRLWQHHFGKGLVPSSTDFGRLGEMPTHPELLDWLANTFMEKGWSMKAMHRLMMTSAAYQQASTRNDLGISKDPENKLLWRYPARRLIAEEIRDSVLSMAGILKLDLYGPPVHPPLPEAVLQTQSRPGAGWPKETAINSARRSVYVHVKRSLSVPILGDHDQAPTDTPCAMRFVSTVPTQALGMINSDFMNEHAQMFAERLQREAGSETQNQIRRGLQLALQREPKPEELAVCQKTLEKFQTEFQLPPSKALQRVALLILNLNEFFYLD